MPVMQRTALQREHGENRFENRSQQPRRCNCGLLQQNLLVAAEEGGLVKLHARGGQRVEILPRLWSSHDYGIAGGMYFHDILYVAAVRHAAGATPRSLPAAAG
jgi:hypothetical protein